MAANGCGKKVTTDKKEGMSGRNVAASGRSFPLLYKEVRAEHPRLGFPYPSPQELYYSN